MESVVDYEAALASLREIEILVGSSRVHPAIQRHFATAIEICLDQPAMIDAQKVRNELLAVRELMGDEYNNLPASDRLIRYIDKALAAVPGEGEQSQAPYE